MPSLEELAFEAEQDIGRTKAFFPILPSLGNRWAASRPWEGRTIGLNLHLTTLTAAFVQELTLGGARCIVSAAEPGTTDPGSVHLLRNAGIEVYTGGDMEDRHQQVLSHAPQLLVDVGFDLLASCLDRRPELVPEIEGAAELSTSGLARLRRRRPLPFPVLNVRDGQLQEAVERRHGIGEAVWQAVSQLTGMHLAGRQVAVLGDGPVGRGIASSARNAGLSVEVVEVDPVRRLFAHYEGFPTPELADALTRVRFVVTATGAAGVLTVDDLEGGRDGLVLLNAGRGGDEIEVEAIRQAAERVDHITDHVVRYRLPNRRAITVLGDGHPLNIKLNSGSPEPVLLQFAVLGLGLEWLTRNTLAGGEVLLPPEVEAEAARIALDALAAPGVLMGPAAAIQAGLKALREGRADEASELFGQAYRDPDLIAADDLTDVLARVASLYAQALLESGRPIEADAPCRQAVRILRRLRDKEGLAEVRSLQDRIVTALAHDAEHAQRIAEQRRIAETPVEELLAEARDPSELAAVYVRKANAHLDLDDADNATPLAWRGFEQAQDAADTTWQVMARIALARAEPDEARQHLDLARHLADAADEFNLISTIAHAARLAGVSLTAHPGPSEER